MSLIRYAGAVTVVLWSLASTRSPAQSSAVTLYFEHSLPQVTFAADEIRQSFANQGTPVKFSGLGELTATASGTRVVIAAGADSGRIATQLGMEPLRAVSGQSYALRKRGGTFAVLGVDATGAMYGGLDIAESIRLVTLSELTDVERSPHIEKRGIKFNIPLDSRTPSYSDAADSAQQNIPEMWKMDFWHEFLDEMARDRYNVLSLWSLHPFPSLVKVPEYPGVALDDVKRTTVHFEDNHHTGIDMGSPEIFSHLETIKKITMDQKIQFWRDVMQYAHDRGIEVYLFTWNIFTWGADGKYGITWDQTNPKTIDYFRRSVRETILTYPLLAGIGVTAGEHMPLENGEFGKEIHNMPGPDKMIGFYMGPDGYTWGREFTSTEPETPRQLIIKKQWYSFMLWGRLSYDPALPDALFEQTLARRFPEVPVSKLYRASAAASKIIPRVTTFSWGDIDVKWFPEGCTAHANRGGFFSVATFMKGESMPGAGVLSIPQYLKRLTANQTMDGMTPLQVADELRKNASTTLQLVSELRPVKNKELRLTLGDYEAMAHLGNYYAEKIIGSLDLALYSQSGKPEQKESAVKHLRATLEHWKKYAAVSTSQYKPQLLTRIGYFDLNQLTTKVEHDIAMAEGWKPHS